STGLTVAVIDGDHGNDELQDAWKRDTVHRWAHAMQLQLPATVHRYSPLAHRRWTRRRVRAPSRDRSRFVWEQGDVQVVRPGEAPAPRRPRGRDSGAEESAPRDYRS